MKVRRWLWLWLWLALLLLPVAAGMVLVSTPIGLQGALVIAAKVLPGKLSYERITGCLVGPLQLENLRYQQGELDIRLKQGSLDWSPSQLLAGRLQVGPVQITGLELHLPPATSPKAPAEPFKLSNLPLPLQVAITALSGTDLQIRLPGEQLPVRIDAVTLQGATRGRTVNLETLEVKTPEGELYLAGQMELTGDNPLELQLRGNFQPPPTGPLSVQGKLSGELGKALAVKLSLSGTATAELEGTLSRLLTDPAWSVRLTLSALALGRFSPTLADNQLSGQVKTEGNLNDFQVGGQLATVLPELGSVEVGWQASGSPKAMTVKAFSLRTPATQSTLKAQGELDFAKLAFKAEGDWQSLRWPLTGTPQVESPNGTFKLSGIPRDYRFTLAAQLQGLAIPRGEWTLAGQGNDQALPQLTLDGKLLEGEIHGNLSAAWQPTSSWQVELAGTGLNPGAYWPDFPGKLAFRLRSQGNLVNQVLQTTVELSELAGTVRGQAVQGKAQLAVKEQEFLIPGLELSVGRTRLKATGSLAQRWDVRWQLEAPDLGQVLPGSSGTVNSSGNLTGSREQPRVELELAIAKLVYGATAIQRLQGKASVDVSGSSRSQLTVTGEGLHLGEQTWKNLSLEGAGTPAGHTLQGRLTGQPGRLELALTGSFDQAKATWQGQLHRLAAQGTVVGDWSLDKPLPLQLSARQVTIQTACLVSKPSRLCIQGSWDAGTGAKGHLSLERLELERFASLLPAGLKTSTSLNGEASGTRRPDGTLQGRLKLQLSPGQLLVNPGPAPLEITVQGGGLQAEFNGKDATAQLNLELSRVGQLQAQVQLTNLVASPRLNGKVTAAVRELGLISTVVPQLQHVSGQLTADLNLSGTPTAPLVGGALQLTGAAADIPQMAVQLQDIQLAAIGDGHGVLQLSGSARSGSGTLRLLGQWHPPQGPLEVSVKGEKFQVADTSEIQVLINPDLTLVATPSQIRVEGQVVIPEARINPGNSDTTGNRVSTSPDVIIVGQAEGTEAPAGAKGLAIYARVRVILGDQVTVNAFDFRGHIKGNVLVEEDPQLFPRGSGSVAVAAGEYTIYGQRLQIERGVLLFANSPLDNPGLDLRVTRTADNFAALTPDKRQVTVGAQVTGTLQNPKLKLFSDPAMPDSSILSYLVLGQAPQTAKQASLTLGRYLSPNLYIGYGVGLFEAVNTFILRYRLNKYLSLQVTSSSRQTGADLFYTIERP
jgi:translocation and assembly module TamB